MRSIFLLLVIGSSILLRPAISDASDSSCDSQIVAAMQAAERLKPGMHRSDVLKDFVEDGGIATRSSGRFLLRNSRYIKIDVEFETAMDDKTSADDIILKVSKPYLEHRFTD